MSNSSPETGGSAGLTLPPIHAPKKPTVSHMDAAMALHQALSDLDAVKRQLRQPFMAKASVEAQINGISQGLRMRSQELLAASWVAAQQAAEEREVTHSPGLVFKPKLKPLPHSTTEKVAAFKSDFLSRPQTDSARDYLQDRYGIPAPAKPSSAEGRLNSTPARPVSRGLTPAVATSVILPANIRNDPYSSAPPEVMDKELDKGLMHLISRGFLPATTDLTPALVGDGGAVRSSLVPMHPHQAQFVRAPHTSAVEDSLLATSHFKLDLLTEVKPPTETADATQKSLRKATLGGALSAAPDKDADGDGGGDGDPSTSDEARRGYNALMDTFSLHEFMIRRGQCISTTPEFESYRRTYEPLWDVLAALIGQIESLCQQYAVPLAIIDGKSLADLAHSALETGQQPAMQDLLICMQNIQEVAALLTQPGRRYKTADGQSKAAVAIQSAWRGHSEWKKTSKQGRSAAKIQGAWRLYRMRKQLLEKLHKARVDRDDKFQALQQQLYQQWPLLQRHTHIVVHIPSLHRTGREMNSEQVDVKMALEAAQLARLCDLAEPLVEVLLILPSPPDNDVIAYWDKILEVGGVSEPGSRYRVVYPENHERLPAHMSSAARMLSSPHSMKRLKDALHGRMAYMLPGLVNEEEVDLAVQLGVPMLGPAPYVTRTLGRKSAARTLFRGAGAIIPPGLVVLPSSELPAPSRAPKVGSNGVSPLRPGTNFTIDSNGDVILTEAPPPPPTLKSQFEEAEGRVMRLLAEALVRCPTVGKWLLKIDDEWGGAGHAFFDVLGSEGLVEVLERAFLEAQEYTLDYSLESEPLQPLNEGQQVSLYRVQEILKAQLKGKLMLAAKDVYRSYREYILAIARRGGVIEACPEMTVGSPCANIFIAPTGEVSVLSTNERIFVHPFRSVGSTFPQSSVPHRALADAASNIGLSCYRAGVIGHVSVDFVTLQERDGSLRLWAVDVDTAVTPSVTAFQVFDFLTVGSFDPYAGTYTVEIEQPARMDEADAEQEMDEAADADRRGDVGGPRSRARSEMSSRGGGSVYRGASVAGDEASTSQRFYFALDMISHAGIAATTCSRFFHACWQEGFHYDVDHRLGIIFNLSDKYSSGALSVLAVGMVPHEIYVMMQKVLSFIATRDKDVSTTQKASWNLSHNPTTFRDVQLLVKYMAEKSIAVSLGLVG